MNTFPPVLCFALVALPQILRAQPNVTSWDLLNQAMNDKNPDKRKQAIAAVGSIGLAPEAIKLTEDAMLKDEDPIVRQTAAAALGEMKSMQSIPALQKALDDASGQVAFQAAKSLWALGDRTCKTTLEGVLTGQLKDSGGFMEGAMRDAKAKLHSPRALAWMGVKEASGALLGPFSLGVNAAQEMLKDGGSPGRAYAAILLAQDCDARAHQLLEWSLKEDKNAAVKAAAARALGVCGDRKSIPILEQYLANSQDSVRDMSAAAIVKLSLIPAKESAAQ